MPRPYLDPVFMQGNSSAEYETTTMYACTHRCSSSPNLEVPDHDTGKTKGCAREVKLRPRDALGRKRSETEYSPSIQEVLGGWNLIVVCSGSYYQVQER